MEKRNANVFDLAICSDLWYVDTDVEIARNKQTLTGQFYRHDVEVFIGELSRDIEAGLGGVIFAVVCDCGDWRRTIELGVSYLCFSRQGNELGINLLSPTLCSADKSICKVPDAKAVA